MDIKEYKDRHLSFWSMADVSGPLTGLTIGAGFDLWSYWQYNRAAQPLFNRQHISANDINPADFVEDQLNYFEYTDQIDDDIIRSAIPLASIPWMEAILGCPIHSTEAHIRSGIISDNPESLRAIPFDPENPWIKKYFEFIDIYNRAFGSRYPVSQSVLRGPSDLTCAILGVEKATIALVEQPEAMRRLLDYVTEYLEKFFQHHLKYLPKFEDGYVIGQYDIWAPESAFRIQEDFSVMYSPQLYHEFLQPLDSRLACLSKYTLIHLHASSLFLIDSFLEVTQIRAFQITKDPGYGALSDMIPTLVKIQNAGKPLIIKGQFDADDLNLIKRRLSPSGLCIQPVARDVQEGQNILHMLRKWS